MRPLGGRAWLVAAGLGVALSGPVGADAPPEEAGPLEDVQECLDRNTPKMSSEQTVEFTQIDRSGGPLVSRAKIYAKRFPDGKRKMKLRYQKPAAVRNTQIVAHETDSCADMWVWRPATRRSDRLPCGGGGGRMPGTDFKYEDLVRWQRLNQPGTTERLADAEIGGRPVYALQTIPSAQAESSYELVRSFIDRQTCVVLREESYERAGEEPVKVLEAKVESIIEENGIHLATELRMDDLVELTHTRVVVEEIEIDRPLRDRIFDPAGMGQGRD